ncbi:hypothetical protein PanWU01x14_001570 [Parasponia andersonii]|uniref:Uncharacterized protein n=1 Tax=Parasponia andersonii TaxID=3476 RepID=A0A2P5E4Z2_PARAD|nr:hypothetical protein PanWU01x14_001570 [Parasponia andersonii]
MCYGQFGQTIPWFPCYVSLLATKNRHWKIKWIDSKAYSPGFPRVTSLSSQPHPTTKNRKLILQSLARSTYQSHEHPSKSTQHFINALRSKADYQLGSIFMAQVGIGSFRASRSNSSSPISYFLHVDTRSNLIRTQCEECKARGNNCFYQK